MQYMDEVRSLRKRLAARHRAGEYAKCVVLGEKLIQLHKRNKNTYSVNFADDLFNLATSYEDAGRFERAKRLYSDSVSMIESLTGGGLEYADRLSVQAGVYSKTGDYITALGIYLQAEHIKKKKLGENHQEYADALYNVGNALFDGNMFIKAARTHEKALAIRAGDKTNIAYADSLNALGYCHEAMEEYAKAAGYFEEALKVTEKLVGAYSDGYVADLLNYAGFLCKTGDYGASIKHYNKAASFIKTMYTENHIHYAEALNLTAEAHEKEGNLKKALSLRSKALNIMKKTLGGNHLYIANSIKSLAVGYHAAGDRPKAVKNLRETLKIKELLIGCANEEYISDMLLLVSFYLEDANYKKTAETLKHALKRMKAPSAQGGTPPYFHGLSELYLLTNEMSKLKDALLNSDNLQNVSFSGDLQKSGAMMELLQKISEGINFSPGN